MVRQMDEDGRPMDGKPILPGDVFVTSTGRITTPYPAYKMTSERSTRKAIKDGNRWIMQNALDEALARGDGFNARPFEAFLDTSSQADRESALLYVFESRPIMQVQRIAA